MQKPTNTATEQSAKAKEAAMFAKGNRFALQKPSDVPGPGAYDPQDPNYDAYKHGAFLEKQDRFSKDKPSEVPGPGTYKVDQDANKKTAKTAGKPASGDRYAVLQRKVEELERLHADEKKSHLAEVDRLKAELNRAQKANAEHSDRVDKLKKQNDTLESRMQELKRTNLSDQSEIKDLRAKLRVAEHERSQLASKQGEAGETKKALQALDAKRRDEVRERDRKIAELEKSATNERKRKEGLESKLAQIKGNVDAEVRGVQEAKRALETEMQETKEEAERARASLLSFKIQAQDTEEELVAQLEQHRLLLSRVAKEYGRLASSTVSRTEHEHMKSRSLALELKVVRLERKLANSEGQVQELANLIRWSREQAALLASQITAAEAQSSYYSTALRSAFSERPTALQIGDIEKCLGGVQKEALENQIVTKQSLLVDAQAWANFERLRFDQLLLHSALLDRHFDASQKQVQQQSQQLADVQRKHTALTAELTTARSEFEKAQTQLVETMTSLSISKAKEESLTKNLESVKAQSKVEATKLEQVAKQEKEINQKLATAVQKSKAAEDALRDEVERLTADLTEAERYQEAYASLLEEVESLVQRNALAEDEAEHLSKFNAEILGHNNPAQRIMYVDRIRGELHETKQELLTTVRERDAALNELDELRYELQLYTSVAVPLQNKPRTAVTRVARTPLASQNLNTSINADANGRSTSVNKKSASSRIGLAAKRLEPTPEDEWEYKEGDMTIEEIM